MSQVPRSTQVQSQQQVECADGITTHCLNWGSVEAGTASTPIDCCSQICRLKPFEPLLGHFIPHHAQVADWRGQVVIVDPNVAANGADRFDRLSDNIFVPQFDRLDFTLSKPRRPLLVRLLNLPPALGDAIRIEWRA